MALLRARTYREAYLYIQTHVAGGDIQAHAAGGGQVDLAAYSSLVDGPDGGTTLIFDGPHEGRRYHFEFQVPRQPEAQLGTVAYGYGPQPSSLIDAGEWRGHGVAYTAIAKAGIQRLDASGSRDERELGSVGETLELAVAALDEVAKFLPAGADVVPDEAFWTDEGRAARARFPDYFQRRRIEADQAEYRDRLADFVVRYWHNRR